MLGLCAAGVCVVACGWHSRADRQRDLAMSFRPVRLRLPEAADAVAEVRTLHVRAWADEEYRAETGDWRAVITAQVRRASAILEPTFGVRLVVDARPWARPDRSSDLGAALDALEELDTGDDADWVVGFVGSLREQESDSPRIEMGRAMLFRPHFVLRATESRWNAELVASFDALTPEEREALARERRLHEETSIFLHEWAHTLGAVHECPEKSLMHAGYSLLASSFSPQTARFVRLGLQHRESRGEAAQVDWEAAYRAEASRLAKYTGECEPMQKDLERAQRIFSDPRWADPRARRIRRYESILQRRIDALLGPVLPPRPFAPRQPDACLVLAPRPFGRMATVRIRLDAAGAVTDVQLERGSGLELVDRNLLECFRSAEPFPPPPALLDADRGWPFELTVRWDH